MASTKKRKKKNQPNFPQAPYSLLFLKGKEILWLVVALFLRGLAPYQL
jgi:hypothetical protein